MSENSSSASRKVRNLVVAMAAVVLTTAVFLGIRTETVATSLPTLAATAVPYEVAQINGKPTLVEFYANWCTTCQAMAGDLAELKTAYGDQINFVMLNVDNNKWLPEMLQYRVDGIPHFVYLTAEGEAVGTAIGEQPRLILADNLEALVAQAPLPHQQTLGQASELQLDPLSRQAVINDDPRAHGSQVVN
ncbi:MAG: redoxin family protein [Leptolyngbyaceae cyanobacterium SM2_3_12]|nr:redoxin family protein [Leptolyngbyaceae cyanobacterium SM2_3_12]